MITNQNVKVNNHNITKTFERKSQSFTEENKKIMKHPFLLISIRHIQKNDFIYKSNVRNMTGSGKCVMNEKGIIYIENQ